jgi:hypothetical protein
MPVGTTSGRWCSGARHPQSVTVAIITLDGQAENRGHGVAVHNGKDMPYTEHARKIAVGRALDDITWCKSQRHTFWDAYLKADTEAENKAIAAVLAEAKSEPAEQAVPVEAVGQ